MLFFCYDKKKNLKTATQKINRKKEQGRTNLNK